MAVELNNTGTIFDIQGFSVHDGPGCRTVVFLKGCTLNCPWCANPEGIHSWIEPLVDESRCIRDFRCMEACPSQAITITSDSFIINRSQCASCSLHNCQSVCFSGAWRLAGTIVTVGEVFSRINRERRWWGDRGGITLSGGEPFAQPAFTAELLKRCHRSWIHTAAETCGYYPWENLAPSIPFLDWIFFDLKLFTDVYPPVQGFNATVRHAIRKNALNLKKEFDGKLVFRMPVISGLTDSSANIGEIIEILHQFSKPEINLLPVHHLGFNKYKLLGKQYYTSSFSTLSSEYLQKLQDYFIQNGITCHIGSGTPY
jgi:glycyl-radical enzyme activating protein